LHNHARFQKPTNDRKVTEVT